MRLLNKLPNKERGGTYQVLQVYVVRGYQRMVERDADRRRVLVVPARGGIWRVVQCMRKAFVVRERGETERGSKYK
jgi:hypothetical protein